MRRAEVWWANLPEPVGRRPVVLVSRDDVQSVRALVTVAPVTTRVRGIPTEVALGKHEGLPRPCVANADALATIPKRTLEQYAGTLSAAKTTALDDAIRFALGLDGG